MGKKTPQIRESPAGLFLMYQYFCFVKTIKIKVQGRVQGVFYRQSAKEKATALGIKGIVKNCADDSVELIATGKEDQLKEFIEWCREGPDRATVTNLTTQELTLQEFRNFSIAYF